MLCNRLEGDVRRMGEIDTDGAFPGGHFVHLAFLFGTEHIFKLCSLLCGEVGFRPIVQYGVFLAVVRRLERPAGN